MEAIIETHALSCRSGRRWLLGDISWQVEKGQHWCVFGLNGCGKTTLLSVIAGFKQPTSGTVHLFGEPIGADNILANRRRIGWVSSSFFDQYYHKESALAIALSGASGCFGWDELLNAEDVKRAKALLSRLGLSSSINHPFAFLSKGQRQNVLLARALMAAPEILVLDEPCSGLDVLARERVLTLVQELAEHTDMTVIYVTHYTEEILGAFEHTMMLKNGHCYAQGLTNELFTQPVLSDFLEYPIKMERDGRGRVLVSAEVPCGIGAWVEEGKKR